MHLFGLALDFDHGVAHLLDQVMYAPHGAIEHLAQFTQLITAASAEIHGHVASGNLVHDRTEGFQGMPGRGVEPAVEIDNQQKHARQGRHQQDHVQAVLAQALLQLLVEKLAGSGVERVSLRYQTADLLIERRPRCIEAFGHHHLFFEQLAGLFQGSLATGGQAAQARLRPGFSGQGILNPEGVIGSKLVQALQQILEAGADRGVEKALAQGIGAHCPAFAEGLGDFRGHRGHQFGE
ncbi:hypothetical protein D3C76_848600 [compost metagenome]